MTPSESDGGHQFHPRAVIKELWRLTCPGGIVAWVVQDKVKNKRCSGSGFRHYELFRKLGFDLVLPIVMEKPGTRLPILGHYGAPEFGLIFSKGKPRYSHVIRDRPNSIAGAPVKHCFRDSSGKLEYQIRDCRVPNFGRRGSIWRYDVGFNKSTRDKIAFQHPAIMPEQMAEDLIISFSRPGDLVLDPMAGSGTTGKMAIRNYRRFIGYEVHKPYVQIAKQRLRQAIAEQQRQIDAEWSEDISQ